MSVTWRDAARVRLTPRPEHITRDDYRRQLEGDVEDLQAYIADAKELLNTETPFLALPEELILYIMVVARDSSPPYWDITYPWADITVVCRRLRQVSRSPTLWFKINQRTSPLCYLRQALLLSDTLPLDVILDGYCREDDSANLVPKLCASQHNTRIRSLTLRHIDPALKPHETFWPLFMHRLSEFPMLTHLSLEDCWIDPSKEPVFRAPPTTLTSLSLSLVPFPWNSRVYDSLVELRLTQLNQGKVPSIGDLGSIFSRSFRLALFEISGPWTLRTSQPSKFTLTREGKPSEHELAELLSLSPPNSLRKWIVHSDQFCIAHYALPPSLTTSYEIRSKHLLNGAPRHLNTILPKHLGSRLKRANTTQPVSPAVAMRVTVTRMPYVHDEEARAVVASFWRNGNCDAAPDLLLQLAMRPEDSICDIFRTIDCGSITYLHLDIASGSCNVPWLHLFRILSAIRTMRISENVLASLIEAVHDAPKADDDPTSASHTTAKTHLNLDILHIGPSDEYGFKSTKDTIGKLGKWLRRREGCGLPLADLRVPRELRAGLDEVDPMWKSYLTKPVPLTC